MESILKYTRHLLKKIKKLSGEMMDHPSGANIHSFRVEVKKLKALVRLLVWYFPGLDKKKLKKLWKLFDKAGAVREWQILGNLILDAGLTKEVSEEVLKMVHHEEKKAYRNFRRNHNKPGAALTDEASDYLLEFTERVSKINLNDYFNYLSESIESNGKQKKPANETYHGLRRDIKELKYNLKVLDEDTASALHLFTTPEFLNECDELLGKWHDEVMATEQLQALIAQGELTNEAHKELVKIRKSMLLESGQWLSKFKNDFNKVRK